MDTNVFISKVEVYEIKKMANQNAKNKQLSIYIFDKDGEETTMMTSIMTNEDIKQYKHNLLQALNCDNWTQARFSAMPTNLKPIIDEEDRNVIVGLESDFGLILKNEIRLY